MLGYDSTRNAHQQGILRLLYVLICLVSIWINYLYIPDASYWGLRRIANFLQYFIYIFTLFTFWDRIQKFVTTIASDCNEFSFGVIFGCETWRGQITWEHYFCRVVVWTWNTGFWQGYNLVIHFLWSIFLFCINF